MCAYGRTGAFCSQPCKPCDIRMNHRSRTARTRASAQARALMQARPAR